DSARCPYHERNCRSRANYDHIDIRPDQLVGQSGKKLVSAFSEPPLNDKIPVLRVAQLTHTAQKCTVYRTFHFDWARTAGKKPNAQTFTRWLRTRCERPCRRSATNKRDELAPPHSITSSAREIIAWGTVIPSASAVLWLIINSTAVACWTGKSAGFSPLRIRPV